MINYLVSNSLDGFAATIHFVLVSLPATGQQGTLAIIQGKRTFWLKILDNGELCIQFLLNGSLVNFKLITVIPVPLNNLFTATFGYIKNNIDNTESYIYYQLSYFGMNRLITGKIAGKPFY